MKVSQVYVSQEILMKGRRLQVHPRQAKPRHATTGNQNMISYTKLRISSHLFTNPYYLLCLLFRDLE